MTRGAAAPGGSLAPSWMQHHRRTARRRPRWPTRSTVSPAGRGGGRHPRSRRLVRGDPPAWPTRPTPTSRCWSSTPRATTTRPRGSAASCPDAYVRRLADNPGFGAAAERGARRSSRARPSTCSATTTSPSSPTRSARWSRRRSAPTPASSGRSSSTGTSPERLLQVGMAVDKTGVARARSPSAASSTRSSTTPCATCSSCPAAAPSSAPTCSRPSAASTPGSTTWATTSTSAGAPTSPGARVLDRARHARVRHLEALGDRRRRRRPAPAARPPPAAHVARLLRPSGTASASLPQAAALHASSRRSTRSSPASPSRPATSLGGLAVEPAPARPDPRAAAGAVKAMRTVPDREVRELQVRRQRPAHRVHPGPDRHATSDRVTTAARSSRDLAGSVRDSGRQLTTAFAVVLVAAAARQLARPDRSTASRPSASSPVPARSPGTLLRDLVERLAPRRARARRARSPPATGCSASLGYAVPRRDRGCCAAC